ncbi:MAG TPA: glutamate-5-semialdehyde dehydrogenase, partial [Microbacteriaceae bacterium]|nr:glutamate-5-semialdehyde dehydrogenase [Microbacteriaceae bacterium]
PARVAALASAVRAIAALPDPVGEVLRGSTLANGIRLSQIRVPLGVIGAIYEARPNVTVDIAALALKSGNAVVLRGGTAAEHSNERIVQVLRDALVDSGLPADAVATVDPWGRAGALALMTGRGYIDVIIPRGSQSLIDTVVSESTVPAIETGAGVVHIYIDSSARVDEALPIVVNAKVQRPSVCNALDTLLIHRDAAGQLGAIIEALTAAGVTVLGDDAVSVFGAVEPVTEADWSTEHLSLRMAIRIVDSLDDALDHIRRYSTKHTEAILTEDVRNAERFLAEVDAAVVMVNSSTRFTDGGEFGFGAEVGISTQKLHARGPMGLPELTSTKWVVRGNGNVRP